MNLQEYLPFYYINNESEFLFTTCNPFDRNQYDNPTDDHIIELFNDSDLIPSNWNTSNCKYLTTEELSNRYVNPNHFTIT